MSTASLSDITVDPNVTTLNFTIEWDFDAITTRRRILWSFGGYENEEEEITADSGSGSATIGDLDVAPNETYSYKWVILYHTNTDEEDVWHDSKLKGSGKYSTLYSAEIESVTPGGPGEIVINLSETIDSAKKYWIYYRLKGETSGEEAEVRAGKTTYTIDNLLEGTEYIVNVRGIDAYNNRGPLANATSGRSGSSTIARIYYTPLGEDSSVKRWLPAKPYIYYDGSWHPVTSKIYYSGWKP